MKNEPKTLFIILLTTLLASCSPPAINPQKTEQDCKLVLDVFKDKMRSANSSEGIEKIYQLQIANMNLDILFNKGCCKYADTCPVFVNE